MELRRGETASDRDATSSLSLTNEELDAVHSCLYDEAYYGDDEVVYGNGEYAVNLRTALAKVEDEAKRRNLWRGR